MESEHVFGLLDVIDQPIPTSTAGLAGRFLVVDLFDRERILAEVSALPEASLFPLSRQSLARDAELLLPSVIELATASQTDLPALDNVLGQVYQEEAGILVASTASPSHVVHHLKRILNIEYENEVHSFRYYDPLVLQRYLAASRIEDIDAVYGPLSGIGFLTSPRAWRWFDRRGGARPTPTPLEFRTYHEAEFIDIALRILADDVTRSVPVTEVSNPATFPELVLACIRRAHSLGFDDPDDLAAIARFGAVEAPELPTCEVFAALAREGLSRQATAEDVLLAYVDHLVTR